jgi:hypothetical protein
MKNILTLLLLLFIGTGAIAQGGQLIIEGLNDTPSEKIMVLNKISADGDLSYVVQKNKDGISQRINNAVTTKQTFNTARVWINALNGNRFIFKLFNVTISDYVDKRDKEQFTLHFTKQEEAI